MPKSEFHDDITVAVLPIGEYCYDDGKLYPIIEHKEESLDSLEIKAVDIITNNAVQGKITILEMVQKLASINRAIMIMRGRLALNKQFNNYLLN